MARDETQEGAARTGGAASGPDAPGPGAPGIRRARAPPPREALARASADLRAGLPVRIGASVLGAVETLSDRARGAPAGAPRRLPSPSRRGARAHAARAGL